MTNIRRALEAAAAGGDSATYVEDVFSTYLVTGDGSAYTANNGLDLDGEGGLVWLKARSASGYNHTLYDTARSGTLFSDAANGSGDYASEIASYNSNGFTTVSSGASYNNVAGVNYVGWSFRKAPGFFDIVTWTGNSVTGREISHNLGSVPGCIIIKSTTDARSWIIYHVSMGNGHIIKFSNLAKESSALFNNTTPTSTVFEVNNDNDVNVTGSSYIAYLFANNEAEFGADADESIIKCGSFTTDGSGNGTVSLGWQPQYLLYKNSTGAGHWVVLDTMRAFGVDNNARLFPNTSGPEVTTSADMFLRTQGFEMVGGDASATLIYIAIRRPMKVPEAATDVFAVATRVTGKPNWTSNFVVDAAWQNPNTGAARYEDVFSRLTSQNTGDFMPAGDTAAGTDFAYWDSMTGWRQDGSTSSVAISWMWRRAPEFMDVVCYTGSNGANITHGLGAVPEMLIVRNRTASSYDWHTYHQAMGNNYEVRLNQANGTNVIGTTTIWNTTTPTASVFSVLDNAAVNGNATQEYIAYLFATLDGISKVGSYTADATLTTIDCGFSAGARFVLIKRTDASGDWYLYDSVRGIVAGNDPYLIVNTETAETTGTDYIDPDNSGFQITAAGSSTINVDTGEYIFLAFA